jgi:hypothetical protein
MTTELKPAEEGLDLEALRALDRMLFWQRAVLALVDFHRPDLRARLTREELARRVRWLRRVVDALEELVRSGS